MDRVLPSEATATVNTLEGLRCWYCWAGEGDIHHKGCSAPLVTAVSNLKEAIANALAPGVEWLNEKLKRIL